jgi:hypothetical protein
MLTHAQTFFRGVGVKYSEDYQKLKMEATRSDFDVLPFL